MVVDLQINRSKWFYLPPSPHWQGSWWEHPHHLHFWEVLSPYGCFLKWWVFPPNHPLKNRDFHYKSSILGYPHFKETPIFLRPSNTSFFHGSWGPKLAGKQFSQTTLPRPKIVGAICASPRLWGWWALNPLVPLSLLLQWGRHCPTWTRRWSPFPVSNDDGDEWEMKWATKKRNFDFPKYWLFNRDPYNGWL